MFLTEFELYSKMSKSNKYLIVEKKNNFSLLFYIILGIVNSDYILLIMLSVQNPK